jgi:WD40 repeat protein
LKTGDQLPAPTGYTNRVTCALSADGRRLTTGDRAGHLDAWDPATGRRLPPLAAPGDGVFAVALSPDGTTLAVGRESAEVELRDAATGRLRTTLLTLADHTKVGQLHHAFFDVPGRRLYAVNWAARLCAWDAATGKPLWAYERGHTVAVSPDGRTVVVDGSSSSEHRLVVLDAATGAEVRRTGSRRERWYGAMALAYSPDGRRLLVADSRGALRVLDAVTMAELASFVIGAEADNEDPLLRELFERQGQTRSAARRMAVSADGRWLATGSLDRTVRVWDIAARQEVRRFIGHEGGVQHVAFGPDSRTLLSAGEDGAIYHWDLRPPDAASAGVAVSDLWSQEAPVAYRAVWALAGDPDATIPALRRSIRPAVRPKPDDVARQIGRLDADRFADREAATQTLSEYGPLVETELRAALAGKPSAEARDRLTKLVERLAAEPDSLDPGPGRAVQVLELIGTPAATALLTEWATGAPGALLTEAARAALERSKRARGDR